MLLLAQIGSAAAGEAPSGLEAFGLTLAGLAVFFTGINFVHDNLKRLTGHRVREVVGKLTGRRTAAMAWGFLMGAFTQSSSAVLFLCVNLLSGGLIGLTQAAILSLWANVGISTIVLFATIKLDVGIYWVVGVSGLLYAFEWPRRGRDVVGAIFGLGLLFLGINLMEDGADLVQQLSWMQAAIASVEGKFLAAFIVGTVLSAITQSAAAVTIIAIVLASKGLLHLDVMLMIIYGSNVGDDLVIWLLTMNLRGSSKQLAMLQVVFNPVGAFIFVSMFYIEKWTGVPLVLALLQKLSSNLTQQGAIAYFLFNFGTAVPVQFLLKPITRALQKRYPVDPLEDASRPKFLSPAALREPDLAVEQARRELQLMGRRLTWFLDWPGGPTPDLETRVKNLSEAYESLCGEVHYFLDRVVAQPLDPQSALQVSRLLERLEAIRGLARVLYTLSQNMGETREHVKDTNLAHQLLQGLEAALLTVIDALESEDPADIALAMKITGDSGDTMGRLRTVYLRMESNFSTTERGHALQTLGICERLMFALHLLTRGLQPSPAIPEAERE